MSKTITLTGPLMKKFKVSEHVEILTDNADNRMAADAYNALDRGKVSRELVRYWRKIIMDNEGNRAKAVREIKEDIQFIKPQPDDDIPADLKLPAVSHRIMVIPDLHAPYHHPDTLEFLLHVRAAFGPDTVVSLGDEADYHALSFHDSDPNLDSAGTELEKAKVFLKDLHLHFPQMLICHSNHGSMQFRRAKAHGIPVQMLKRYRDVLLPGIPSNGWAWRYAWRLDTPLGPVLFKHQAAGTPVGDAAHEQANLVVGHMHGTCAVDYAASSGRLYWAMTSGCLIDKDALAFAYGKHSKNKPIIACSVIEEGVPRIIPMLLDEDGRWVGRTA